jgi:hypothetical protein
MWLQQPTAMRRSGRCPRDKAQAKGGGARGCAEDQTNNSRGARTSCAAVKSVEKATGRDATVGVGSATAPPPPHNGQCSPGDALCPSGPSSDSEPSGATQRMPCAEQTCTQPPGVAALTTRASEGSKVNANTANHDSAVRRLRQARESCTRQVYRRRGR